MVGDFNSHMGALTGDLDVSGKYRTNFNGTFMSDFLTSQDMGIANLKFAPGVKTCVKNATLDRNSGSVIDLVLTSNDSCIRNFEILEGHWYTDHRPVIFELDRQFDIDCVKSSSYY